MKQDRIIQNERAPLAASLWAATANDAPDRPALHGGAEADVVVIGAGFTGLSAALHLAEAGKCVIVLEAETPGWGASGRNGGQVNPGLKADPDQTEAEHRRDIGGRMVAASAVAGDLVFGLIKKYGIDCDANRCGWVRSATSASTLAALSETGRQWRARGHAVDEIDADEMARLLGVRHYVGGLIDRRGGNLHPLNYALGLAAAAERAGAKIHGQSRVKQMNSDADSITVTTDTGSVTAGKALICTNAYTGPLADPLGQTVVPVTSVQVATEPLSDNVAHSILPEGHSPSDTRRLLVYFRKDAHGRFIMGGRGALSDKHVLDRQQALRDVALDLYPQLDDAKWRYAWGGDVALTRSHAPGLHKIAPNAMAGIGFNGRGVGMATVMGRILADWAAGCPEDALDYPVTRPQPIPFHRFRRIGLGATVALFGILDRFSP
ncbi:Gamma-glutamylputrescine oxidoreductase [Roseobacter fucihabitans]|uniref:Gamma-glutamylputrescine oxidoreductase n=1 Tax=Roseobacter fucihabitans TaxID=1537242 RepID=A0ABZ2BQT6_9RHOB|nr:FAD-binding oxidoreductase [Roseobacter litoralis]MBC6967494.1 Gamma-glutamylputrescine oxidoreductase [Roseobacter litoralis]